MHKQILEEERKIKQMMEEEFEEALEEEDLETICMIMKMECMMQDFKEEAHKAYHHMSHGHNPYGNPGHTTGTADIKTMNPAPHGHGYGTVQFTTTGKE